MILIVIKIIVIKCMMLCMVRIIVIKVMIVACLVCILKVVVIKLVIVKCFVLSVAPNVCSVVYQDESEQSPTSSHNDYDVPDVSAVSTVVVHVDCFVDPKCSDKICEQDLGRHKCGDTPGTIAHIDSPVGDSKKSVDKTLHPKEQKSIHSYPTLSSDTLYLNNDGGHVAQDPDIADLKSGINEDSVVSVKKSCCVGTSSRTDPATNYIVLIYCRVKVVEVGDFEHQDHHPRHLDCITFDWHDWDALQAPLNIVFGNPIRNEKTNKRATIQPHLPQRDSNHCNLKASAVTTGSATCSVNSGAEAPCTDVALHTRKQSGINRCNSLQAYITACTSCTTPERARLVAASKGEAATVFKESVVHPGMFEVFERYTSHNALTTANSRSVSVSCDACSSKNQTDKSNLSFENRRPANHPCRYDDTGRGPDEDAECHSDTDLSKYKEPSHYPHEGVIFGSRLTGESHNHDEVMCDVCSRGIIVSSRGTEKVTTMYDKLSSETLADCDSTTYYVTSPSCGPLTSNRGDETVQSNGRDHKEDLDCAEDSCNSYCSKPDRIKVVSCKKLGMPQNQSRKGTEDPCVTCNDFRPVFDVRALMRDMPNDLASVATCQYEGKMSAGSPNPLFDLQYVYSNVRNGTSNVTDVDS